jgi:hypothetical protein
MKAVRGRGVRLTVVLQEPGGHCSPPFFLLSTIGLDVFQPQVLVTISSGEGVIPSPISVISTGKLFRPLVVKAHALAFE